MPSKRTRPPKTATWTCPWIARSARTIPTFDEGHRSELCAHDQLKDQPRWPELSGPCSAPRGAVREKRGHTPRVRSPRSGSQEGRDRQVSRGREEGAAMNNGRGSHESTDAGQVEEVTEPDVSTAPSNPMSRMGMPLGHCPNHIFDLLSQGRHGCNYRRVAEHRPGRDAEQVGRSAECSGWRRQHGDASMASPERPVLTPS
jgi:hypothetical protein